MKHETRLSVAVALLYATGECAHAEDKRIGPVVGPTQPPASGSAAYHIHNDVVQIPWAVTEVLRYFTACGLDAACLTAGAAAAAAGPLKWQLAATADAAGPAAEAHCLGLAVLQIQHRGRERRLQ